MLRRVAGKRRKTRARFQLRVIVDETIHLYPLPTTGQISIGRATGCDVRIEDPTVSRHHAVIEIDHEALSVRDAGSSYGLRVRQERVLPGSPVALGPGDAIEAGSVVLVIEPAVPPKARGRRRRSRATSR